MKFLIGTHRWIIKAELTDNGELSAHSVADGQFYGMTRKPDGRHIIARRQINKVDGSFIPTTPTVLQVWDADITRPESVEGMIMRDVGTQEGMFKGLSTNIPLELHDVHQIAHDGEGLYICDCIRNQLLYVWDDGNLEVKTAINFRYIEHCFYKTAMDRNHPNTVVLDSNNGFAILLHNKGHKPSEIIFGVRDENRALFDYGSVIPLAHHGAHNLFFIDQNNVVYNASADGEVVHYDTEKREVVRKAQLDGHTKGMLPLKEHLLIGVSDHAKYVDRFTSDGSLVLLRLSDFEVEARWDFSEVGNINEIYRYD